MSYQPPALPPAPTPSSSGFKLVLKRAAPPPSVAPPAPSPSTSALAYLADAALEQDERQPSTSNAAGELVRTQALNVAPKQTVQATGAGQVEHEARGVSSSKYRALRRTVEEVTENRDDAQLALFRAQKLIVRLRDEKSALLDRVLDLEQAAGLVDPEISSPHDGATLADSQRNFPLLDPPVLPSLADRPRVVPVITTTTELNNASYNDPTGPPPIPLSHPPRQRSLHLTSTLAAQRLRDDADARRAARGLAVAPYPIVAVLGLEGSVIAGDVERALKGEAPRASERKSKSSKRKRDANGERISSKGKGKLDEGLLPSLPVTLSTPIYVPPNPYAGIPGMEYGGKGDPTAIAAAYAAAAAAKTVVTLAQPDPSRFFDGREQHDSQQSPGGSIMSYDDAPDYDVRGASVEPASAARKKARVMATQALGPDKPLLKPKRLKSHGITTGRYSIPQIPRHPDGLPILPLPVGIMILKKLGVITPREHFHTERYIFPIGFECMRKYPSMIDPVETVEYTSRIVDSGEGAPKFEIVASDQPGVVISAGTPTGAWSQIVKAANRVRARQHSNSVSGPDYYGLAQNVVKALIQELPGAQALPGYIWQIFDEDESSANARSHKRQQAGHTGPNKVTGSKRKYQDDAIYKDPEEGGLQMRQSHAQAQYNGAGPYAQSPSVRRSTSPQSNAGYESFVGSSSLGNLLHHQSPTNQNPYSLPIPIAAPSGPVIDPSLDIAMGNSLPLYDAYALPLAHNSISPSQNGSHSTQLVDPNLAPWAAPDVYANGQGSSSGGGELPLDPAFLQDAYSIPVRGGGAGLYQGYDLPVGQNGYAGRASLSDDE